MKAGAFISSFFWIALFTFHYQGNSWGMSLLLAFSGLVAGLLISFGVMEKITKKEQSWHE